MLVDVVFVNIGDSLSDCDAGIVSVVVFVNIGDSLSDCDAGIVSVVVVGGSSCPNSVTSTKISTSSAS